MHLPHTASVPSSNVRNFPSAYLCGPGGNVDTCVIKESVTMAYYSSNCPRQGHVPSLQSSLHARQALTLNSRTSMVSGLASTAVSRAPRAIKAPRLQCRAATEAQSMNTLKVMRVDQIICYRRQQPLLYSAFSNETWICTAFTCRTAS